MDYLPYAISTGTNVIGWVVSLIWLWRALATGKLHTDREFQDRVREAARIEKFYADEKAEDKAALDKAMEALAMFAKSAERREPLDELTTKVIQTVQQAAVLHQNDTRESADE